MKLELDDLCDETAMSDQAPSFVGSSNHTVLCWYLNPGLLTIWYYLTRGNPYWNAQAVILDRT